MSQDNCELRIYYVDDSNKKNQIAIKHCKMNDKSYPIKNGNTIYGFDIEQNKTYRFEVITNQTELFASEVEIRAHR